MRETSDPVVVVNDLRVETLSRVPIIDEISLRIEAGEVFALVGESGCGKTTLAMALLGHARRGTQITSGSIMFGHQDLLRLPERELRSIRGRRISYVPQDPTAGLNPRHRVGAQILESLVVHGTSPNNARDVAFDLLARVGLPCDARFARRYPFELSGGQQQRVAIAMALACKPAVVVLDEPTTGLDVTTQARVLDLLRELSRELRSAFVYVTHDLAVVDGLASRVCVMYAGRIIEGGSRAKVFGNPAHPYTSMLLSSVPTLKRRVRLSGIAGAAPPPEARPQGCFFQPRCPVAIDVCSTEFPGERAIDSDHSTRCWLAPSQSLRVSPSQASEIASSDARSSNNILVVDGLSASYGAGSSRNIVLKDISFSIARGQCLAVVGETGSGKSTLGRCIAGLHLPDSGRISLHGHLLNSSVTRRSPRDRKAIQLVFQNPERSLNPRENVYRAIARPLRFYGISGGRQEPAHVMHLLDRVGLRRGIMDRYPAELSGGEKQRVAIARGLAARPDLLVCDEITSSLDVSVQAAVVSLLDELRRDGLTLLLITHNLALVNSLADSVLVLERGMIREHGGTPAVIGRPTHPYTQRLVTAVPNLSSFPGRSV